MLKSARRLVVTALLIFMTTQIKAMSDSLLFKCTGSYSRSGKLLNPQFILNKGNLTAYEYLESSNHKSKLNIKYESDFIILSARVAGLLKKKILINKASGRYLRTFAGGVWEGYCTEKIE